MRKQNGLWIFKRTTAMGVFIIKSTKGYGFATRRLSLMRVA
jgi:hypothetical protein